MPARCRGTITRLAAIRHFVTARAMLLFSQGDDTVDVITILGVFALSLSLGMAGTCGVLACMLHVMAHPRPLHADEAARRRTA